MLLGSARRRVSLLTLCSSYLLVSLAGVLFVEPKMSLWTKLLMHSATFLYMLVVWLLIADLIFPSAFRKRGTK